MLTAVAGAGRSNVHATLMPADRLPSVGAAADQPTGSVRPVRAAFNPPFGGCVQFGELRWLLGVETGFVSVTRGGNRDFTVRERIPFGRTEPVEAARGRPAWHRRRPFTGRIR